MISRFEVYYVNLDPTSGSAIRKTRPCVVISPNEMNRNISTIIIAPLTSKLRKYPTRVPCRVEGKQGQIVLDQIRTIDKTTMSFVLGSNLANPFLVSICSIGSIIIPTTSLESY